MGTFPRLARPFFFFFFPPEFFPPGYLLIVALSAPFFLHAFAEKRLTALASTRFLLFFPCQGLSEFHYSGKLS